MAVSPDLLLNIKAPESRSSASAARTNQAAQSGQDKGASFAQVYAKERQAKPAQPAETAARPAPREAAEGEAATSGEPLASQELAADGKELPVAEAPTETGEEAALDAVLLLGLPDQMTAETTAERQLPGVDFASLPGAAQPSGNSPLNTDELAETEETLLGNLSPSTDKKAALQLAAAAAAPQSTGEVAALATKVLQSAGEKLADSGESDGELSFGELLETAETPSGNRTFADPSLNRMHPLAQAISAQNLQPQQAQQPVQVPGQSVQIQQGGWSEAVVDRVMWMSSQNLKSAEIQLDPAELGRMEVRIEMSKEQTQVTFLSAHAGVRDQLEGQMQRLRDMFAQQGMSMDVNVSDQSQARGWQGQGQDGDGSRGRSRDSATGEEGVGGTMEISADRSSGDRGLVDYYA